MSEKKKKEEKRVWKTSVRSGLEVCHVQLMLEGRKEKREGKKEEKKVSQPTRA